MAWKTSPSSRYFKERKWKPFAISYAYIYRGKFTLLLLRDGVSLWGSMLFPNSVTFHVHQNPASAKCELNSLSGGGNRKSDDSICSVSKGQRDSQGTLFQLKVPTAEKSHNLDPHWLYSSVWWHPMPSLAQFMCWKFAGMRSNGASVVRW